ncbi:uncharacterized protein J4E88_011013 [Alternaria novae-zelandiae]|uniref:uncharacterized protein n=1 Tax=Alternaria novae-zelandiae TaxID=430562 RepID=UPI0020C4A7FA|nr:uncharacterized protein J4E88_011013 [Alternaria novae-zelandiae]KAI4659486.1 hypothetical protein J4E88_011013 [Alternaria novae-zelandiae]
MASSPELSEPPSSPVDIVQDEIGLKRKRGGRPKKDQAKSYRTILEEKQQEVLDDHSVPEEVQQENARKIQAWNERWGPDAQPEETEGMEGLRGRMWHHLPKCRTCAVGRKANPSGDKIPIGLNDIDTLPCGCPWEEAMVEEFLSIKKYIPCTPNGNPTMIPSELRRGFKDFLFNFLHLESKPANLLSRNGQSRARAAAAKKHGTKIGLNDNFV